MPQIYLRLKAINLRTLNLRLLAGKNYLCTNYRIYEQQGRQ